MTLNHIHIGTKDISSSIKFYINLFGFSKKFDHGEGVFLENKMGFLIAIDPVSELPKLPSWFHLGFCLQSEKEVLDLYDKCIEMKVNIARDMLKEPNEFASFYILDPDGYKIEVSWHNE